MIIMANWSRYPAEPEAKPFPGLDLGDSHPRGLGRGRIQPVYSWLVCRPCIPSTHWSMSLLQSKLQLFKKFPLKAGTHPPDILDPKVCRAEPSPDLLLWRALPPGPIAQRGGHCGGLSLPAHLRTDPAWEGASLPPDVAPGFHPAMWAGQATHLRGLSKGTSHGALELHSVLPFRSIQGVGGLRDSRSCLPTGGPASLGPACLL